ncbi:hypothetical protein GGS20DRAFT_548444 [Poronia punctata]|nr:hypothetical protein GGS20DRAFT_548444 [Poronia punctata]
MHTQTQTVAAALMAFAATVNGHITMKSPVPFGSVGPNKVLTNSPLSGNNYPCQVGSDPAKFYSKDGIDNKMEIGKPQTITFDGSAVHGGGSCQLALTSDPQPSISTSWQVILSIEGGCPTKSGGGGGTDEYEFTIPDGIKPGDYVFAWTWISKLSGTQEFYMNCAPVSITGGSSSKRQVYNNETMELFSRDSDFPELMVANLETVNGCKSTLSSDPKYPNPGKNTIRPNPAAQFAPINGENCVPKGAKDVPVSGGGGGSDSGSATSSSSSAPAETPTSSAPVETPTSAASTEPAGPSSGGVFFPHSSSAAATSVAPTPTPTTLSTVVSSSSAPVSSSAPANTTTVQIPSSSAAPSGAPSGTPSSGLTGPCSSEGMFNCIGGTSYQQCASGSWTKVGPMAAGTKCAEGQTMTLWARDNGVKKQSFRARRWGY